MPVGGGGETCVSLDVAVAGQRPRNEYVDVIIIIITMFTE